MKKENKSELYYQGYDEGYDPTNQLAANNKTLGLTNEDLKERFDWTDEEINEYLEGIEDGANAYEEWCITQN